MTNNKTFASKQNITIFENVYNAIATAKLHIHLQNRNFIAHITFGPGVTVLNVFQELRVIQKKFNSTIF